MGRVDVDIRGESVPPPSVEALIARIAGRQHGVVSRAQLLAAGVASGAIDRRLRTGRLHSLHRGVYAAGHRAVGPRGAELAAVLSAGKGAVLSHQSAAALWGLRPVWRGPIHVLARRALRHRGLVAHKARALHPRDTTRHHGIPVTTPARTLLDLGDHVSRRALERALAQAEVLRLVNRDQLHALLQRSPGRRPTLALLLDRDAQAPTRSELEATFLAFVADHDLPRPLVNQRVLGYEVDFHWPEARLIVEVDGYGFHAHREAFETDRARDAMLQLHGWRVIRLTARRLAEQPGAVAHLLARLASRGPAPCAPARRAGPTPPPAPARRAGPTLPPAPARAPP